MRVSKRAVNAVAALGLLIGMAACRSENPRARTAARLEGNSARGEVLFNIDCAGCHGRDGRGTAMAVHGGRLVDLPHALPWYSKQAALSKILLGVPGTTMAPYPKFSDQQLADIYAYMHNLPK